MPERDRADKVGTVAPDATDAYESLRGTWAGPEADECGLGRPALEVGSSVMLIENWIESRNNG